MNLFNQALAWLQDSTHWSGPTGIPTRVLQHLGITVLSVVLASLVALPIGVWIGHLRRGSAVIGALAGGARAIPTLGLLTLFGLWLGIGLKAPVLALVVLAVPSLLAGAYSGIGSVEPSIAQAAKAIGMTPLQVVSRVELPLSAPVLIGGVRAATLQVVATATMAAYTSDTGLGRYLFAGLKTRDYPQMLAGALLVVVLTLVLDLLLAACQRLATRWVAHPERITR